MGEVRSAARRGPSNFLLIFFGIAFVIVVVLGGLADGVAGFALVVFTVIGIAYGISIRYRTMTINDDAIVLVTPPFRRRIPIRDIESLDWESGKQAGWVEICSTTAKIRFVETWFADPSRLASTLLGLLPAEDSRMSPAARVALERIARQAPR